MNIVKHNKNFIFFKYKIFECDIIFILNIENNIYFILFFIHFTKYKYNII